MGKIRLLVLTSLVALFPAAFAQNNAMQPVVGTPHVATRFVNLDTFNLKALIPPPPPSGSFAAQVDLETVLQAQAWRTAEQIAWAKLVEQDNVFNHASIFGAWFKGDRLPMTSMFFKHVGDDMRALEVAAKAPFQRSRPSSIDSW